jgi:hypothetical protein
MPKLKQRAKANQSNKTTEVACIGSTPTRAKKIRIYPSVSIIN